jgi:hypothetical protein
MSLRSIFSERYAEATARQRDDAPGEAFAQLKQGAAITVRVQGRRRQVILSRHKVFVSEAEIATFRRDGRIPPDATRADYTSRDGRCHVALTWEEPQTSFTGMPEAELPESLDKVADAPTPQQGAEGAAPNISEL